MFTCRIKLAFNSFMHIEKKHNVTNRGYRKVSISNLLPSQRRTVWKFCSVSFLIAFIKTYIKYSGSLSSVYNIHTDIFSTMQYNFKFFSSQSKFYVF